MAMASRLPTGTVTFLFTDIEGSTRLWERFPDAMREALAAHDALFREVVPEAGGAIFKTVGDAICAAFERPEDAARAAVGAQRRLTAQAWPAQIGEIRVRMGIHTGTAQERDDDYFGRTVNRVARLMSIAHGGQILVSGVTADLLHATPPDGVELRDLGHHRLKDLAEAEHTYQLVVADLRADFPELASLDAHPNNLPSQISSFVGRDHELGVLRDAVAHHRVVTIAGPGGIGKTRLALHLGADVVQRFKDGVWFVELALLEDASLLPQTVADALGVREQPSERIAHTVVEWLAKKQILLLLDNSEHLISDVASFTREIVRTCPSAHVLVTSRQPLHMSGEHVVRLGPLPLRREGAATWADLSPSEHLFLERATDVRHDLQPSPDELAAITRICRRLEGIPLAIELAAARVATLAIGELDRRLGDRFRMLVSRDPSRDPRQRTLRATIEWSYRLLDDDERGFACELSVFSGSFTLAGAEAVTSVGAEALDLLESMVSKSFVAVAPTPTEQRYVLYDTIREFLARELADSDALRERHAAFYRGLLSDAAGQQTPEGLASWLDRVAREIHNLRSATDWALEHRPEAAAAMLDYLARYWQVRGHIAEGYDSLTHALRDCRFDERQRAPLLRRASTFATISDDYEAARRLNNEARDAYHNVGDVGGVAEATFNAAVIAQRVGDDLSAEQHYASALEGFRTAGHVRGRLYAIMNLSMLAFSRGDLEAARPLVTEAATLQDAVADANLQSDVLTLRGTFALESSDFAVALAHFRQALSVKQEIGNTFDAADLLAMIALAHVGLEELKSAENVAREALRLGEDLESHVAAIDAHEALCEIAVRRERYEESAQHFVAARELRHRYSLHYVLASTKAALEVAQRRIEGELGRPLLPSEFSAVLIRTCQHKGRKPSTIRRRGRTGRT